MITAKSESNKKSISNLVDDSILILLACLFAMPVLPKLILNILIIGIVILSLTHFYLTKNRQFRKAFFLLNASLYICYILSLLYTENIAYGFKKMETSLSILVFPLIFSLFQNYLLIIIKNRLKNFIKIYVVSNLILLIIIFGTYLSKTSDIFFTGDFTSFIYTNAKWFKLEPLYIGFYTALSLLFTSYLFYISARVWKAFGALLIIAFLFTTLIILGYKAAIFSFFISVGILAFLINRRKMWGLFSTGVFLIITLVYFSSNFNSKFSNLLVVNALNESVDERLIRLDLNYCNATLLPKAGVFGFGIGDGKEKLSSCLEIRQPVLSSLGYNNHNQYSGIILNVGYLGLILFLVAIIVQVLHSLSRKNVLGVSVSVFFLLLFFSENFLERQDGVMLYMLFVCILYAVNYQINISDKSIFSSDRNPHENL